MGVLKEERRGAEVQFSVEDDRVHRILDVFCRRTGGAPPESWGWERLGRQFRKGPSNHST